MKKYYNTNYSYLATLLLPVRLRAVLITALLRAMVHPLDRINDSFVKYRDNLITSSSSQVCYLQAMLNDEFDYLERRIKIRTTAIDLMSLITHDIKTDRRILVPSADNKNRVLLNARYQIGSSLKDFEIVFPAGYTLSESEQTKLKLIVNRHKLASKKYSITNEQG